jgi:hypothetical protein
VGLIKNKTKFTDKNTRIRKTVKYRQKELPLGVAILDALSNVVLAASVVLETAADAELSGTDKRREADALLGENKEARGEEPSSKLLLRLFNDIYCISI